MCGELHPDLTSAVADSVSGPPAEEQSAGHVPVRSDGGLVARLLLLDLSAGQSFVDWRLSSLLGLNWFCSG